MHVVLWNMPNFGWNLNDEWVIIMIASKEDIIAAYKIFLNRHPESSSVLQNRIGKSIEESLIEFTLSDEFLNRADVAEIIQKAAKIVAENEKSTTTATLAKPQ